VTSSPTVSRYSMPPYAPNPNSYGAAGMQGGTYPHGPSSQVVHSGPFGAVSHSGLHSFYNNQFSQVNNGMIGTPGNQQQQVPSS